MHDVDAVDWLPVHEFDDVHDSGDKLVSALMDGSGQAAHADPPRRTAPDRLPPPFL